MLYELIEFGGVIFWLIAAAIGIGVFVSIYHENGTASGWLIAVLLAITILFTSSGLLGWVAENSVVLLIYAAGYMAAGSVVSVVKWSLFVRKVRDWCDDWLVENPISKFNGSVDRGLSEKDERKRAMRDNAGHHFKSDLRPMNIPPEPGEFKDAIGRWIGYWPIVLVTDILGDGVARLVAAVRGGINGIMRRISGSAFGGFDG